MKFKLLIIALALASCVSNKKYNALNTAKMESEEKLKGQNMECEMRNEEYKDRIIALEAERTALDERIRALLDSIADLELKIAENDAFIRNLGDKLDEQTKKLSQQLEDKNRSLQAKELELNNALAKAELERTRQTLLREELQKTSDRVRSLEMELSRKDSAVRALKDAVADALKGFDGLDIMVENRNGRVYVSLSEKLLFKSGSIAVDPKGEDALIKLAGALAKQSDVQVMVEGHTDNKPMNSEKIKDNWDLSVLRATSIVRILTEKGKLNDKNVLATGRGETMPVASNDTAEGRAKNRRTEIILTPRLEKILDILNSN